MEKLEKYRELKMECLERAASYEERGSYEMAYMSMWKILEKGLFIYANEAVRLDLQGKIKEWEKYLSGEIRRKPKEVKNFSVDYTRKSIPQVSLIEKVLGKMKLVGQIMDPKGKWRSRRNNIAHDAADFSTVEKYKEYKHDLLEAIDEFSRSAALYETKTT